MSITKNKKLLIVLFSGLLCGTIYAGFDTREYQVDVCRSTVSKYVTAEFSEVITGIDMEGDIYTEVDYWSDQASEVHTETVSNERPFYPDMPEHDVSIKNESNFDSFKFHVDTKLTVEAFNDDERTSFNEEITKSEGCLNMIGNNVAVKRWWSITYGSDFAA